MTHPMERASLSDTELYRTMETALALAGVFYATLAQAWFLADPENKRRLVEAFPRLVEEYGPGSRLYQAHLRRQDTTTGLDS